MKRINSLKIITTILAFATFGMVLKSCKKVDNVGKIPTTVKEIEAAKAAAQKYIVEKYGNVSASVVIPINKVADSYAYRGNNGTMQKINQSVVDNAPGGLGNRCIYTCNNTNDPNKLKQEYTLKNIQRLYVCESNSEKSNLIANWTVSVPYTILTNFNGNNSTAQIKITSPSNSVLTLGTTFALPATITNLGVDPLCNVNTLYTISYKISGFPNSYFGVGMQIDASLSLYNDCALLGNLVNIGFTTADDFSQTSYLPCNRIDLVYFYPASSFSSISSNHAGPCTNPVGWTSLSGHQVEYRLKNSTGLKWDDQTSPVWWSTPSGSNIATATVAYGGTSYTQQMVLGSGQTWLIRYRNIITGSCNVIQSGGNPTNGTPGSNGYWGNETFWNTEIWNL